jgi:hypothetical protein
MFRRPLTLIDKWYGPGLRYFASKKGGKKKEVEDDGQPASFSFASYEKIMENKLKYLTTNLSQIHVGRANPSLLDKIHLIQNGKRMLLSSVAQIHAKDANSLMVVLPDEEVMNLNFIVVDNNC